MSQRSRRVQRILLIDDSPEDRARVRAALIEGAPTRRYHFREAVNGESGIMACQREDDWEIDCIITDVHMPKVSGTEFLKLVQDPDGIPKYPIVVLTGSSVDHDSNQVLQLGAQDYITKDSIYPSILFRVVDNAIERHRLTQELHASRIAADSASRAKSAMIGNISHEIRTPMTAVMGLTELLLDDSLTDDQVNLLQMIRDNGAYLIEIVNDLLDLSKLEAGKLEVETQPVDLPRTLHRVIQLLKVRATELDTELHLHVAPDVPKSIESDPIRLRQILINIVGNAIKFSPGGKVIISVSVEAPNNEKPLVNFQVEDNGVGIAHEDLETIFEPFVQSEQKGRAKAIGGTGLGLAICRRLVALLGGKMSVESQLGKGSSFGFTVPLIVAEAPPLTSKAAKQVVNTPVEEVLAGCEFLVAEDTLATQVLLKRIIEKVGGVVEVVDNGNSLLKAASAHSNKYAAIITDIQMPGLDGLEVTRILRQQNYKTPIIVLTADALSETREMALEAGASEILTKPIDRKELLNTLARYCDNSDC